MACCVGVWFTSRAAESAAAELTLAQPAPCISVDELSFRVSRALGQALSSVAGPQFAVAIRPSASGFQARLEISDSGSNGPSGLRLLNAASCEELADSLALAIALALGPRAATDERAATPEAPAAAAIAAPVPDAASSSAAPSSAGAPAHGPQVAFQAALLGDTGSLPGAGLGGALGARLAWTAFELRAEGLLLPARETLIDADDSASPAGELGLLAGALLACTPLSDRGRALLLSACAGAELGRISGTGLRVATPHPQHAPWFAARIDLAARWPLPKLPIGLELLVTAAAPLLRDEFILKDIGPIHQPPNVIGRAGLGLGWVLE